MRLVTVPAFMLAIALASAGCSLLPAQIECSGVEPATCQRLASEIIARKNAEDPPRRVIPLVINNENGGYDLTWDDGTGESMFID